MSDPVNVSVIIPSYNSAWVISLCLDAVLSQKTNLSYEIIVVDSSEGAGVYEICKRYPKVKFIRLDQKTNAGIARNAGAKESSGDLLIFIDSDVIIEKEWIQKAYLYYQSGHHIFGGAVGIWEKNGFNIMGRAEWYFTFSSFKEKMKEAQRWYLPSVALAIKKVIFMNNNFSEIKYAEDVALSCSLKEKGFSLSFTPNLLCYHNFRGSFFGLIKKYFDYGLTSTQVKFRNNAKGKVFFRNNNSAFLIMPFVFFAKICLASWRNIKYNTDKDRVLYVLTLPFQIFMNAAWVAGAYRAVFNEYQNKNTDLLINLK